MLSTWISSSYPNGNFSKRGDDSNFYSLGKLMELKAKATK